MRKTPAILTMQLIGCSNNIIKKQLELERIAEFQSCNTDSLQINTKKEEISA